MEKTTAFSVPETGKSFGDPKIPKNPLEHEQRKSIMFNNMAQVSLRMLAILFTLTAISVIVTDKQSVTVFSFQFKARYSYSSAFRFLVGADGVVCSCSALSLAFLYLLRLSESTDSQPQLIRKYFFLFLHDMVMLVLVVSGCAAATAVGYVGRHGEDHMAWQKVCDQVSYFCNKMIIGILLSYLAFFAYFSLTLLSAYSLMMSHPFANYK